MNIEDEMKILKLGFTMQRALEKALDEIKEITSQGMSELKKTLDEKELTINKIRQEEEARKKQWEIRESIDQWHKD